MEMDMQHGHAAWTLHAAWTWTRRMYWAWSMDRQYGHVMLHVFVKYCMFKSMLHGHVNAACSSPCYMDWNMQYLLSSSMDVE
jgi:hypothetical protein